MKIESSEEQKYKFQRSWLTVVQNSCHQKTNGGDTEHWGNLKALKSKKSKLLFWIGLKNLKILSSKDESDELLRNIIDTLDDEEMEYWGVIKAQTSNESNFKIDRLMLPQKYFLRKEN